jgi:hypothetical protein
MVPPTFFKLEWREPPPCLCLRSTALTTRKRSFAFFTSHCQRSGLIFCRRDLTRSLTGFGRESEEGVWRASDWLLWSTPSTTTQKGQNDAMLKNFL